MGRHSSVASLRRILFTGSQARGRVATAPLLIIKLVDNRIEVAHRVADEAFAAGRRNRGCYRAICGGLVLPASLTAPARVHCSACERGGAPTRKSGGTDGD